MGRAKGVLIFLEEFLGRGKLHFWKPRVFFSGISLPSDKIMPLGWSSFVTNDLLDFVMFLVIDKVRWRRGEVLAVNFIFMIGRKKGSMECVVNFPRLWESEIVGDGREYFCDGKWSLSLGGEFGFWKGLFKVLSFKPYLGSLLEGLEVSPGSALHGLSGKVMSDQSFFSHSEEGV